MSKPTFLLIDGHSLAFRAFYSMPINMQTSSGLIVNAVYGFAVMLINIMDKYKPTHAAVAFDLSTPTFRHTAFKDYKAHRKPTPEEFKPQVEVIREFVRSMDIPVCEIPGFEADDVLGALAKLGEMQGWHSLILTSDKDAYQLINEATHVLSTAKGISDIVEIDRAGVVAKWGLTPEQVPDLKGLMGDPSDNIPGVPGIGEKTALKLLHQYRSIEGIYEHLEDIEGKSLKAKLENNRDKADLSRKLATIETKVPLDHNLEHFRYVVPWNDALEFFRKYEMHSLVKRAEGRINGQQEPHNPVRIPTIDSVVKPVPAPESIKLISTQYKTINRLSELKALLPELKHGFAVDLETTSADAMQAAIVGVSFCAVAGQSYYVPLAHLQGNIGESIETAPDAETNPKPANIQYADSPLFELLEPEVKTSTALSDVALQALALLKPLLEKPDIPKYAHNGKYEIMVLRRYGIDLCNLAFDTMVASYVLDANRSHGLKPLASELLGMPMSPIKELLGSGKAMLTFAQVPVAQGTSYACADADACLRLKQRFESEILDRKLTKLFYEIEMPLVYTLTAIEMAGIQIDREFLSVMSGELNTEIVRVEKEVHTQAGITFNLNSPKQLGEVLFTRLKLPVVKKTQTGPSTDVSVLEKLASHHPIAALMMDYRELSKLKNTYVDALPEMINADTGRVHTSFNQSVTTSGRLSSSDPNLQNIPVRTELGRQVRKAFVAPEGKILLVADYSQIELRILAHITQDKNLIDAYQHNADIHARTAALVFNVPESAVTKELRSRAKTINFGIVYGQGAYALAEQLSISRTEAQDFISNYFRTFPGIREYMENTKAQATRDGYVETLLGRRWHVVGIDSLRPQERANAERAAVNMPIQGTAADIIKIAMNNLDKVIQTDKLPIQMILQVHDELIFELPFAEIDNTTSLVTKLMSSAYSLKVPLVVNIGTGPNWLEAK